VTFAVALLVPFLGGLAGSLHCVGMCGVFPLALRQGDRPVYTAPSRLTPPDDRGRKATEGWIAMAGVPEDVQRWTAKRRMALVLSIIRGETSVAEAARKHALTVAEIEQWQGCFLTAAENALRSRPKDKGALKDEHIKKLKQKVGELVLDLDILREAAKGRPADATTSGE
jgi:hypothetical protein